MRTLLTLCAAIVIALIVIGFYRSWFVVQTNDTEHRTRIEIDVNKNKVKEDEERAREKAKEAGKDVKERVHDLTK